ncbi:DUF2586 domain-containing protein [Paenibacillus alvei]|uniref:DUF2586 domain-containing protein n=1 Tax=Paenibacillus alvei TaxID=44250 RepID=UPI00028862B4|nr:DUF2586 domain-containing protein [Paenibacillus alvei]EJW16256.1 hypothetical protein PAV_6c03370 [Paenibacillus alvei DSM 29]MCY9544441.1 DUF2586 domain-containing protein [Paenibacillus alvei]MCY9704413.1 DUF2586 domain-containing protein [Paenibacillus alvei]MCY9736150.1 DUF2586 domain-containing protein [Paenibacillus alvei]MCY9756660.1 DUF2586 domain-containing protein [Paenibacillus alvei]
MLRDVSTSITDGGLGIGTAKGEGVHVKIGVSPVTSSVPIIVTGNMSASKIKELLGASPLADATMDSVDSGSNKVYCLTVAPSVPGKVGKLLKEGTGTGNATVTGTPNNAYEVIIKITVAGGLNAAALRYSIDGISYSDELTLPASGELLIPETGLTFKFTETDTDKPNSFKVGDSYKVATKAPQMSNKDVLSALDKLRSSSFTFEFIHIVGESAKPLWAALTKEIEKFHFVYKRPVFMVCEATRQQENESIDDYVQRLITDRKGLQNYDLQVVSARSRYTRMDGRTQDINNAGIVCGLYARANPQQSVGETKTFSIPESKMKELLPAGIEDYIGLLDEESFLTFRRYEGLEGFYVTNARMMAPEGSDYRYAEDVRIKNKLIRQTRKEALIHLQSEVDMTDVQGSLETIAKFIETPIDEMVRNKEISAGRITVPAGQDILTTEKLEVIIRYVPVGHIREIRIDLGMENPFKGGAN